MRFGAAAAALALSTLMYWPPALAQPVAQPAPKATKPGSYAVRCIADGEVPPDERAKAETVALTVAVGLTKGTPDPVYATLAAAAKAKTTPEVIARMAAVAKTGGAVASIRMHHIYRINENGGHDPLPVALCGKSVQDPERAELSMRAVPVQYYVEAVVHGADADRSLLVWLIPEGDALKVLSLNINLSGVGGRSARDLYRLAQGEAVRSHTLNAGLLFQAAEATAGRGPNDTPVWKRDLDQDLAAFRLPKELSGAPPYSWMLGDQTYLVGAVAVQGQGKDIGVVVNRRLDNWTGDAAADADNRKFIDALVKARPELAEAFHYVAARALRPDGTGGFATAYVFGKGYAAPPPA